MNKKSMKNLIIKLWLITNIIIILPNTVNAISQEIVRVKKIQFSHNEIVLKSKSETKSLEVIITPKNATDKTIVFESSNTEVVTIDGTGSLVPKANGTAIITATSANGKTTKCKIIVQIPIQNDNNNNNNNNSNNNNSNNNNNNNSNNSNNSNNTVATLKKEDRVTKILNSAKKIKNYAIKHKWVYYSGSGMGKNFKKVAKQKRTSCANYVCLVLQDCGILKSGHMFYGGRDGKVHYQGGTKTSEIKKNFNIIHVNRNSKFKFKKGDVVMFSFQHTAIYAGNGKWYDAGRGSTNTKKAGGVFTNMYRKSSSNKAKNATYVFRPK